MKSLLTYEIKRIRTLERFWGALILTMLAALGFVIYTKATFFNGYMFTIRTMQFQLYAFNIIAGVSALLCMHTSVFTKKSIDLAKEHKVKSGTLVFMKWLAGALQIAFMYAVTLIFLLLLGLAFGAHNTAFQVKAIALSYFTGMLAAIGTYTLAMFFQFLTAFPVLPIIIYVLLMGAAPIVLKAYGWPGFPGLLYSEARSAYSLILLGSPNINFLIALFFYTVPALLLSIPVFVLKKKRLMKKNGL